MTNSFFKASNLYLLGALIAFSATAVYGVLHYNILRDEQRAVVYNEQKIAQISQELRTVEENFKKSDEAQRKEQEKLVSKINTVLPFDENYTDLTRQLDLFFAKYDTPSNPIFQSSLRYGKSEPVAAFPGVSALPLSMNIESTRDNFLKFLEFVSNSGSLESNTRLMDITSIQLNFPDGGEVLKDPKQQLNFTVDMNAYHQSPKVAR